MVKARTDPEAPEAVLQLLQRIDALQQQQQPPTHSASSSTAAPLDTAEALSLLSRCLDLALESPDELSASFKYGLDALRLWANQLARLLSSTSSTTFDLDARQLLFPKQQQLALADIIWSACHSERTQVSSRTRTVFEAVIALLDAIYLPSSSSSSSQQPSRQYPDQSAFLITLVDRALSQLERKQSPIVLEVIIAHFGSAPFLTASASLLGSKTDDAAIYERMIRGLGTVDGGANRRSRLALSFLIARADDLGCPLRPSTSNAKQQHHNPADPTSPSWQAWSSIWIDALTSALKQGGERLRSGLASYHLASLFDLDTRVFPTLLHHLLARSSSDATINVESVFLVLRIAKLHGLCRIDSIPDFATADDDDSTTAGSAQLLVPASLLEECILAAASELQISALSLVIESKTPAAPLTAIELGILRTFFPHSLAITNPAARGELRGFFVKLLTRLRASTYALARDIAKIARIDRAERYEHEVLKLAQMQQSIDTSRHFLEWMVQLVRSTLHPGASYQSTITSLTFLDLILESGADPSFSNTQAQPSTTLAKNAGMSLNKSKQVFSQQFPFAIKLITPSLVLQLLACSESTYDDIQTRALTMLSRFPAPLAGLETAEAAAKRLLGRSAQLLTSTRDFESAAASKLLQLYRTLYMQQLAHQPPSLLGLLALENSSSRSASTHTALTLIFDLFDFLDYQLKVAESGEILVAATSHPLHGTLVALQELFSSVALHSLIDSEQEALREAVLMAQELIDRVWCITKAVLCNSAPEGSTQAESDPDQPLSSDPNVGLDQPASHETALAMQAASDDDAKLAFMQPQEESNAGPKHQVILSYSWRGMKEASALLGVVVATCLAPPPLQRNKKKGSDLRPASAVQPDAWRKICRVQDIEAVGERFNRWLTQVRHRGAFSTIYPAYADAAAAIVRTGAPDIAHLPQNWITAFLDMVARSGAQLSITRRSAGIGYAVLALVSAQPNKTDASVLRATVERLMQIATQYTSHPDVMPVASIHALNILRVLVMDGGLTDHMSRYLGALLELTISTFHSRFWGLRNVSMMLFSSLSIKIFGSRNTNKDTKEARMPVDEFFAAYPDLDAFLQRVLAEAQTHDGLDDEGLASSLFAVVMLFSRMQAPEKEPQRPGEAQRMDKYRALLSRCLDNKVWKVRQVAVKAYAAFVPLRGAAQHAASILDSVHLRSQNEVHGKLLLVQRLLQSVAEAEVATEAIFPDMSSLATAITDKASLLLELNRCAVTQTAYLEVVQDFVGIRHCAFRNLGQHLLRIVGIWIATSLSDLERPEFLAKLRFTPGGPELASTCARLQLQIAAHDTAPAAFIDACERQLKSSSHDVRISSLEALIGDDGIEALQKSSLVHPERLVAFIRRLHAVVQDQDEGIWHRVHSAAVLHEVATRNAADGKPWLSHAFSAQALVSEVSSIAEIASTTTCVPFREALLPYFSDLCKLLVTDRVGDSSVRSVLQPWCRTVAECANEEASVQSREAACQALRVLGSLLFPALNHQQGVDPIDGGMGPSLFQARIAAIQLLTDDDEDVRAEAAALIGETVTAVPVTGASLDSAPTSYDTIRELARRGGAGPDVSTERAWSWMAAFYDTKRSADAEMWTKYVWQQLTPDAEVVDKMFDEAFAANTLLFVEEKPNQFRDPELFLRLAAKYARPELLEAAQCASWKERTASDLCRLQDTLAKGLKRNEVASHLLAMQLLLTHTALGGSSSAQSTEAADSIASALSIDLPSLRGSRSEDDATRRNADESSKSRYNIA
ncbi:hypothetical protein L1887_48901 [Cichorium endivia]|nr:hypothetical protein L1887_48901 [Cichorium endivia]